MLAQQGISLNDHLMEREAQRINLSLLNGTATFSAAVTARTVLGGVENNSSTQSLPLRDSAVTEPAPSLTETSQQLMLQTGLKEL